MASAKMSPNRPRWIKWTPIQILGQGSFGVTLLVTRDSDAHDGTEHKVTLYKALKIFWDTVSYKDDTVRSLTKSSFIEESTLSLEINRKFLQNSLCPNFVQTTRSLEVPLSYLIQNNYLYSKTKYDKIRPDIPLSADDMKNIEFPILHPIWSSLPSIVKEIEKFAQASRDSKCGVSAIDGEIPTIGFIEMELAEFGEASVLRSSLRTNPDTPIVTTPELIRSISFQLYAMWKSMKLMGLQHRDINPRNLLFTRRTDREYPRYSSPYIYNVEGIEYRLPEDQQQCVALLADFSLSTFINDQDDLDIESPKIAADARPPEFFFIKNNETSVKYTFASELFSLGMNLITIILSWAPATSPFSLNHHINLDRNTTAYKDFQAMMAKKQPPPHDSMYFDTSGRLNPFGFILKRKEERYVWRLFTLLGVPTNKDWEGIEDTQLWALAAPFFFRLNKDRLLFPLHYDDSHQSPSSGVEDSDDEDGGSAGSSLSNYDDPSKNNTEIHEQIRALVDEDGLEMLKAMLMWDPVKREDAYEAACEKYFEKYLVKDNLTSTDYIQSYASYPIGWNRWGLQHSLRRCLNVSEDQDIAYGNKGYVRPGPVFRSSTSQMISSEMLLAPSILRTPITQNKSRISFNCCNCGKVSKAVTHFYDVYHDPSGGERQYRYISDGAGELPLNDVKPFSFKAHICSQECSDALFSNKDFMFHAQEPSIALVRHHGNLLSGARRRS